MDIVQLLEIAMLLAFGLSWPFNISKSFKSRTAKGKSVIFEYIILGGYAFGLASKFILYARSGDLPYSVWFYIADMLMVIVDMALYYRNIRLDMQRDMEHIRETGVGKDAAMKRKTATKGRIDL